METTLILKSYMGGGVEDALFPNADNPIEIGSFRYDAKRMGGAPTITASVNYPSCLDDEWTDNVYAEFNGEKYYLKQTPTSSYNNESVMYKHDLELVSERRILDDVYFFDVVTGEPQGDDKPVSNSTKVVFFGGIREFASRLQKSLEYSGLGYTVVVDEGIETDEKMMSFEDQFFSNVLQEIYNTYEVPYYFDGKVIHIGYSKEGVVVPDLAYGIDDALVSITKNNANYKIVNRATGTGSSDNIPFYYPNNSPKGNIKVSTSRADLDVKVVDYELFSNKVQIGEKIRYEAAPEVRIDKVVSASGEEFWYEGEHYVTSGYLGFTDEYKIYLSATKEVDATFNLSTMGGFSIRGDYYTPMDNYTTEVRVFWDNEQLTKSNNGYILQNLNGETVVSVYVTYRFDGVSPQDVIVGNAGISCSINAEGEGFWYIGERIVKIEGLGLRISDETYPQDGDEITQELVEYINTSQTLLPCKYRETKGKDRFYNATNDTYVDESGNAIVFANPYIEGRPKEHIISVENIKPTIEGMEVNNLRIDMFSEFAYDEGDNDETYEDEDGNVYFKHPYFYGKLRVMDFNLFDHAIEQQPMTISFTSGDCGACNFEIGVTEEYPQKNPVQVDDDGNLVRDEKGMIVAGVEGTQQQVTTFQDRQQDTSKYEVWIALRKEEATYGILMPQGMHKPKACSEGQNDGDTFVILGINLPQSYILNAERKLESEIVKYLQENNNEKFTFSIGFSRIFFEENVDILNQLSENSKVRIIYDNKPYDLYVSSFSYSMSEDDVLPEIRVELDDTLKASQNALQNAISQVKSELGRAIGNIDVLGATTNYFIRKDADDEARGKINFVKGIKFGEGGKVEVLDNNSAKLTIEYLEVTKKASFTSLEIKEKTHVGGQILVTPAALNCGEVEELEDAYRCYFQTKGADGDEIFNQFAVGDQAICQTFNAWGSKYYWRLVTGVGDDYIDLSKTDCDEGSGVPSAGDKIIQMGNRRDAERQNAIVIAAYGDGSPYIIQYKGINAYEIPNSKIVTKLSSTENIFTGKVHMQMGSDGLESLSGWNDLQLTILGLSNSVEDAEKQLENVYDKATADGLIDEAERRAIEEAQAKVDAAKKEMEEYTNGAIGNLEIGGSNLLLNSGFSGNYVTQQLAEDQDLDSNDELFSSELAHWEHLNVFVQDSDESVTGKEAVFEDGAIAQELVTKVEEGENYVFSFKAKGQTVSFSIGGFSEVVKLSEEWERYVFKFTTTKSSKYVSIYDGHCTMTELQLEKGDVVSGWAVSPWDNKSELARYQALQYLESAIAQGSTDVLGGVILSNIMLLGNPDSTDNNAGVSGIRNHNSDVAFWGGGSFAQAVETAIKYEEDPQYQPTQEELANLALVVITHGGKAILNDVILRGKVYATGGEFKGRINVDAPNIDGRISLDDFGLRYFGKKFDGTEYTRVSLGGTCQGASIVALAPNAFSQFCTNAAVLAIGDESTDAIHARGDVLCYDGTFRVNKIGHISGTGGINTNTIEVTDKISFNDNVAFQGTTTGIRTKTRVMDSTGSSSNPIELSETDFSVLVNATSGNYYIKLPSWPMDGQEYWLETKGADVTVTSSKSMWSHWEAELESSHLFASRGVIRFKYYEDANQWTYTWVESH